MNESSQSLEFRPRARIIRTIGDQLISGPEAAVIELVKNAYDADASFVIIKFIPPLEVGQGRIIVRDDGHGMALRDIQDKWMEPATSSKVTTRLSLLKRRVMMGSKGIGRFAAAKLGRKMALMSVTEEGDQRTEILIPSIDWAMFSGDTYLSDIRIEFLQQPTDAPSGTTIEIDELNEPWSDTKLSRLHLELRRLISPIQTSDKEDRFRIFLDLAECSDAGDSKGAPLRDKISTQQLDQLAPYEILPFPLLTACDYEVVGIFDPLGTFHGTMEIKRGGRPAETVNLTVPIAPDEESCGDVGVHLYLFDREGDAIKDNLRKAGLGDLSAKEARQILDGIAGVAIYREGFRVRPYGDAENDWLTLDRRRVQDPSLRIGHNQVAGYITVEQQEASGLEERSSREGFEQNASFQRLQRLIRELLSQIVEPKRFGFREAAGISRRRDTTFDEVRRLAELNKIREIIELLAPSERASAGDIIDRQSAILSEKIDFLEDRQRVLEAKSSLGAIIGEVLHEGTQPAAYIATTAARLAKADLLLLLSRGPQADALREEISRKLPLMADAGTKLTQLFTNLQPLAGGKRGPIKTFNPVNVLRGSAELFTQHNIDIAIENPFGVTELVGYPDDLSTAAINIISNAVHWLEARKVPDPKITIHLFPNGDTVSIFVDDNAGGIPREFAERIFNVGFTLKDQGTGLGLNIAKEALDRSGGSLSFHPEFPGGARFEIRFPTHRGDE